MAGLILRRAVRLAGMLFAVSLVTFVVFYVFPAADPAVLRAGRQPTPELVAAIRTSLGLDRPLPYQYAHFLNRLVFHLDLGQSYTNDVPVRDELLRRVPVSAYLAAGAAVLALGSGVLVGIVAAVGRDSWKDRFGMALSLLALSAPPYWLGLILLFVLSSDGHLLRVFPGQGSCIDFHVVRCAPSFVLPWAALAMAFAGFYARLTRTILIETLGRDFVRSARAKGVAERGVVFHHALRPALTPIASVFAVDVALLLSGAVLVEAVFNLPGLGRYAFDAVRTGDLPAVQGTVLVGAVFVVVANAVADVVYGILDPRVRTG